MIAVFILRWIGGYFDFTVSGRFPERFLNLAAKNGVNIFKIKGSGDGISACAKISERKTIIRLAEKCGCSYCENREHGMPVLCRQYRQRLGLLAGLAAGSIFCVIMSGYIWNISINCPEGINEYELRSELRELGFYEGARYEYVKTSETEHEMLIRDGRISWLSINVSGTNAAVEISSKTEIDSDNSREVPKAVSNLVSSADGKITKVSLRSGTPAVKAGEGIAKGQMLASGITELSNGETVFSDCEGEILAETAETAVFFLPKERPSVILPEAAVCKRSVAVFGLNIPLSLVTEPGSAAVSFSDKRKLTLFSAPVPVFYTEERFYEQGNEAAVPDRETAEALLKKRDALYGVFLEQERFTRILEKKETLTETDEGYRLEVRYRCERNIAEKVYIDIRDGS